MGALKCGCAIGIKCSRKRERSREYRIELGGVTVAKSHQGRGLLRRIIGQLISLVENENLFATTRADAQAMRFATDYGFKPPASRRGYDLVLYLRSAEGGICRGRHNRTKFLAIMYAATPDRET